MDERRPGVPPWLGRLVAAATDVRPEQLSAFVPPRDGGGRDSAVLVLFGEGPGGPDVLLIERSATLSSHPGQPAFPGGTTEPGDDGPVATALREAAEEVALDPTGVDVVAVLPALHIPVSDFVVTPVLGWWRRSSPVHAADPAEVARVERVPIAVLTDPAHRLRVRHPSGHVMPAFDVHGMLVWGFTAGLLDRVLDLAGWTRPWNRGKVLDLPPQVTALLPGAGSRGGPTGAAGPTGVAGTAGTGGVAGTVGTGTVGTGTAGTGGAGRPRHAGETKGWS